MNKRCVMISSIAALLVSFSLWATTMSTIINKLSENSDKIQSFSARAHVRYHKWPSDYDRIGRYDFLKPDSTRLYLDDSVNGTDTLWREYSSSSLSGCAYYLVPSVVTEPLMASSIYASWAAADSAVISRDVSDTCDVIVYKNGNNITYTIDMSLGLVVALSDAASGTHQCILWGQYNGIYYLRRIRTAYGSVDTLPVTNGGYGYDFFNIQLNGDTIASTAVKPYPRKSVRSFNIIDRNGKKILLSGIQDPMRVTIFDIRGRRLFMGYSAPGGIFDVSAACSPGIRPSGPLILRVRVKDREAALSDILAK